MRKLKLAVGQVWVAKNEQLNPDMYWRFQIIAQLPHGGKVFFCAIKLFTDPNAYSVVIFDEYGDEVCGGPMKDSGGEFHLYRKSKVGVSFGYLQSSGECVS